MDYHILEIATNQKTANVIFHFKTPETKNEAGLNLKDTIIKSLGGLGKVSSVFAEISEEEKAKIEAGEIIEKKAMIRFSRLGLTSQERIKEIKNAFETEKIEEIKLKEETLRLYSISNNVL